MPRTDMEKKSYQIFKASFVRSPSVISDWHVFFLFPPVVCGHGALEAIIKPTIIHAVL